MLLQRRGYARVCNLQVWVCLDQQVVQQQDPKAQVLCLVLLVLLPREPLVGPLSWAALQSRNLWSCQGRSRLRVWGWGQGRFRCNLHAAGCVSPHPTTVVFRVLYVQRHAHQRRRLSHAVSPVSAAGRLATQHSGLSCLPWHLLPHLTQQAVTVLCLYLLFIQLLLLSSLSRSLLGSQLLRQSPGRLPCQLPAAC